MGDNEGDVWTVRYAERRIVRLERRKTHRVWALLSEDWQCS